MNKIVGLIQFVVRLRHLEVIDIEVETRDKDAAEKKAIDVFNDAFRHIEAPGLSWHSDRVDVLTKYQPTDRIQCDRCNEVSAKKDGSRLYANGPSFEIENKSPSQ